MFERVEVQNAKDMQLGSSTARYHARSDFVDYSYFNVRTSSFHLPLRASVSLWFAFFSLTKRHGTQCKSRHAAFDLVGGRNVAKLIGLGRAPALPGCETRRCGHLAAPADTRERD